MRIGVIAVPGTFDSTLTSVLDVLGSAEALRPMVDPEMPELVTVITGVTRTARTRRGLTVPIEHDLPRVGDRWLDLLVVPALGVFDGEDVQRALERPVRDLLAGLGPYTRPWLAAGSTGSFLLAEAGCLENHRATTSWWLSAVFARRYPDVELDMSRMVVESGSILTAGAAFAHIDLAISIVSRLSPRLAETVAGRLLIDERPTRSIDAALSHLARSDSLISDLEAWLRANLSGAISIDDAARAIGRHAPDA